MEWENICFMGGGMCGLSFAGVSKALEELGLWPHFKRYIGSSAGAIFAGLAACNAPYELMITTIEQTDFSLFMDGGWGIAGEGYRLEETLGLYEGDYFYNWYGDALQQVTGNADITLQQIYDKYNHEVVVTGSNMTQRNGEFLHRGNNPDTPLRKLVRISMSLPIFYKPVQFAGSVWVDGGYLNNYPLEYFDDLYPPGEGMKKTLGFMLRGTIQPPYPINNLSDLVTSLLESASEEIQELRFKPEDAARSIVINTFDIRSTDFGATLPQIQQLIASGESSVHRFFGTDPEECKQQ